MSVRVLTALLLLIVALYGLHEAWPLLTGPQLAISSPQNGEKFDNNFINISGTAVHTKSVTLDGGALLTDQNGHFETTLTLPPGGAILSITAADRFGRTVTVQRTVFVP
jgi:hypothetical protein